MPKNPAVARIHDDHRPVFVCVREKVCSCSKTCAQGDHDCIYGIASWCTTKSHFDLVFTCLKGSWDWDLKCSIEGGSLTKPRSNIFISGGASLKQSSSLTLRKKRHAGSPRPKKRRTEAEHTMPAGLRSNLHGMSCAQAGCGQDVQDNSPSHAQ